MVFLVVAAGEVVVAGALGVAAVQFLELAANACVARHLGHEDVAVLEVVVGHGANDSAVLGVLGHEDMVDVAVGVVLDGGTKAAGLAGLVGGLEAQVDGSHGGRVLLVAGNELDAREAVALGANTHVERANLAELIARKLARLAEQHVHVLGCLNELMGKGVFHVGLAFGKGEGVHRLEAAFLAARRHHGQHPLDAEGEVRVVFYQRVDVALSAQLAALGAV